MCRIVGFTFSNLSSSGSHSNDNKMQMLNNMRDSMVAGGPDYGGSY